MTSRTSLRSSCRNLWRLISCRRCLLTSAHAPSDSPGQPQAPGAPASPLALLPVPLAALDRNAELTLTFKTPGTTSRRTTARARGGSGVAALTVPVPLRPRLHSFQVRCHQQLALESDRLAFSSEGDPEFLQKLDIEVRVWNHSRQGHCAEQTGHGHRRARAVNI